MPPTPPATPATPSKRNRASFQASWQRYRLLHQTTSPSHTTTNNTNNKGGQQHHPYQRQYSHVYKRRLDQLRSRCLACVETVSKAKVKESEKEAVRAQRIVELQEGTLFTVCGTLVKRCPHRPSDTTLDTTNSFGVEEPLLAQEAKPYCNEAVDEVLLEDESGRVALDLTEATLYVTVSHNDEEGRMLRQGKISPNGICTGVIAAITGIIPKGRSDGVMLVQAVHFPQIVLNPKNQVQMHTQTEDEEEEDAYILLASGLHCGANSISFASSSSSSSSCNNSCTPSSPKSVIVKEETKQTTNPASPPPSLMLDLLVDFISGRVDLNQGGKIARVILAGGNCTSPSTKENHQAQPSKKPRTSSSSTSSANNNTLLHSLRELDLFLTHLLSSTSPSLQVDILPGVHDPTNAALPQQPLHKCLLPYTHHSYENRSGNGGRRVWRSTNPYEAKIDEKVVYGTDGFQVRDLAGMLGALPPPEINHKENEDHNNKKKKDGAEKSAAESDSLEKEEDKEQDLKALSTLDLMEHTLLYSHMAPTMPDSIPSFPFGDTAMDPFCVQSMRMPSVYFVGNCREFATRWVNLEVDGGDCTKEENHQSNKKGEGVRLVCVPSFVETGQVVLVNARSLEVEVVQLEIA